jgi:putative transcriptional regulator
MKKKDPNTPMDSIRETLEGIGKVIDNKKTMHEFDQLQYEEPKVYSPSAIARLRTKRLGMSQAVFARVCNIRLSTLQKWERGVAKPTPPVNRLFQLVEKGGLELISKK